MSDASPSQNNEKPDTQAVEEEAKLPAGHFAQLLLDNGFEGIEPAEPDANGLETIFSSRESLVRVGEFLRDNDQCRFDFLVCATGMDWKTHRETVYHLESLDTGKRVVLKVKADENDHSPSLTPVWPAADWHERETYDLMGIVFDGHPDLRRILMPNYWEGFPLRKGYKEEDPRLVWNRR